MWGKCDMMLEVSRKVQNKMGSKKIRLDCSIHYPINNSIDV